MIRAVFKTETAERNLERFANRQLAFATALALTRTAQEFIADEARRLPSVFRIRNGWVAKGFRVKPARKDDLVAIAYHRDKFMALQELGGTKRPQGTKRTVAVPVDARKDPMQLTPRSKWPAALKRAFVVETKRGDVLLLQRTGRKVRRARGSGRAAKGFTYRIPGIRDPRVRVMYLLARGVQIPRRWGFADHARTFMARRFATNLEGMIAFAVKTAK